MRRSAVPIVVLLALLLAFGGIVAWRRSAVFPERLWVFMPDPPWSETPPAYVAAEPDGPALPRNAFSISPATQSADVACVAATPGRLARTLHDVFGQPLVTDVWWPTGEVRAVKDGKWHECVRSDLPPARVTGKAAR